MPTIHVDEEIFGFLEEQARPFEEHEPNDVLRRLLFEGEGETDDGGRRPGRPSGRNRAEGQVSTRSFVRDILDDRFAGDFRQRGRYQYMFESDDHIVYFQNFNKADTPNLWYRIRESAISDLTESSKEAYLCLTNPAEGIVYVLPVDEMVEHAREAGLSGEDLEVNIDPSDDRWRELGWDLSQYRERYDPS